MISRDRALEKCGIVLKGILPKKKKEIEDDFKIREESYKVWLKKLDELLLDYRAYRAMNPEEIWDYYEEMRRKNENTKILYQLARIVRQYARTERKKAKDKL